jgi:hypothetical protein
MASPHSAGAVALLWSCNPDLVGQVDLTFQILQENAGAAPAGTCGAPPDGEGNYTFGYGYLDVLNAGLSSCSGLSLGTLQGYVTDLADNPIEGARVTAILDIEGNQVHTFTNPDGFYTMKLFVGTYNVTASNDGYLTANLSGIEIIEGDTLTATFALEGLPLTYLPLVSQMSGGTITNGDFEQGHVGWTEYSTHGYELILPAEQLIIPPYDGTWAVWLGGDFDEISYIQQQVVVPSSNPYLSYWYWIGSQDICGYDFGSVLINGIVKDEYSLCASNNTGGWVKRVIDLSIYAEQSVSLQIRAECDDFLNSNLFIDHVGFQSTPTSENQPSEFMNAIDTSILKGKILKK